MQNFKNKCFVCESTVTSDSSELNPVVNLRVCFACKGSKEEKRTEEELLDSLADGLVCGCI